MLGFWNISFALYKTYVWKLSLVIPSECGLHTLRLTFPTIQENASAASVLPHFLEVCGRKLDNAGGVLDRLLDSIDLFHWEFHNWPYILFKNHMYLCLSLSFFTSHIGEVEQDRHPTVQRAWAWNLWYIPWISGLPHLILTQDCEIDWDSRRHNAKLVSEPRANASRSCSDSIFQAILFLTCLTLWKLHT